MAGTPTKSAMRMRRHREQRNEGVQVVALSVESELVDSLVANGRLSEREALDGPKLADAVVEAERARAHKASVR